MRDAIGFVIMLWALSHFFPTTFAAIDTVGKASLRTLEEATVTTQLHIIEARN